MKPIQVQAVAEMQTTPIRDSIPLQKESKHVRI